jgi:hypothetical protein
MPTCDPNITPNNTLTVIRLSGESARVDAGLRQTAAGAGGKAVSLRDRLV